MGFVRQCVPKNLTSVLKENFPEKSNRISRHSFIYRDFQIVDLDPFYIAATILTYVRIFSRPI